MSETKKRCKDHPKYRALEKPTVLCERCWQLYFGINEACIGTATLSRIERMCEPSDAR